MQKAWWFTHMKHWRGPAVFAGAGALVGVAVAYSLWWLGVVGVALFIWRVRAAAHAVRRRRLFLLGWLSFTVTALIALEWFWSVLPLDHFGVTNPILQWLTVTAYWLPAAVCLGVGGGVVALSIRWLVVHKKPLWLWPLLVPAAWVFASALGSLVFSLYTWAPGIVPNIGFSFGYAGYALADHSLLLQAASWGGAYVLTVVLVWLALGVLYMLRRVPRGRAAAALAAAALVLFVGDFAFAPAAPAPERGVSVGIVNTWYDSAALATSAGRTRRADELRQAVEAAAAESFDYLLLPEDSRFTSAFSSAPMALNWMRFLWSDPPQLIDSGYFGVSAEAGYLRAQLYAPRDQSIFTVDKQYLVPQGEYVPLVYDTTLRLIGQGGAVDTIKQSVHYQPGPRAHLTGTPTRPAPVLLFCSESVMPYRLITSAGRTQAPFAAHPVSHAWFSEPRTLFPQLDAMLRVQAVWSGLPIVSAGNMSPGKVYYPNGAQHIVEPFIETSRYNIGRVEL